jgi:hypothetical protein
VIDAHQIFSHHPFVDAFSMRHAGTNLRTVHLRKTARPMKNQPMARGPVDAPMR